MPPRKSPNPSKSSSQRKPAAIDSSPAADSDDCIIISSDSDTEDTGSQSAEGIPLAAVVSPPPARAAAGASLTPTLTAARTLQAAACQVTAPAHVAMTQTMKSQQVVATPQVVGPTQPAAAASKASKAAPKSSAKSTATSSRRRHPHDDPATSEPRQGAPQEAAAAAASEGQGRVKPSKGTPGSKGGKAIQATQGTAAAHSKKLASTTAAAAAGRGAEPCSTKGNSKSSASNHESSGIESENESESESENEIESEDDDAHDKDYTPECESQQGSDDSSDDVPPPKSAHPRERRTRAATSQDSGTTSDNMTLKERAEMLATRRPKQGKCKPTTRQVPVQPQPPQQSPAPIKLLVIEAFAGSFPVAQYIKQQQQQQGVPAFEVVAYAAIEKDPAYMAPTAEEMGLRAENINILQPRSVGEDALLGDLPKFVRNRLADAACAAEAVVVMGGPPCTAYSIARTDVDRAFNEAKREHAQGSTAAQAQFESRAAAYGQELDDSDQLVTDSIALFRAVETACGGRPCYLVMENPYSKAARALWNRKFLKDHHLRNLPKQTKAQEIAADWQPSADAWLNSVFVNYCTFGPNYAEKPTVLFKNLPEGTLPDRKCADMCQREGEVHATQVNKQKNAHDRAKWPVEVVAAILDACSAAAQQP